jgi:hypothetical protein
MGSRQNEAGVIQIITYSAEDVDCGMIPFAGSGFAGFACSSRGLSYALMGASIYWNRAALL